MVEGSLTRRVAGGMTPVFANVTYRHVRATRVATVGGKTGRIFWDTFTVPA
jgi:hypothetical protein